MGRHMTFTLAITVALSAVIPGIAGYLSARAEAIASAERSLHAMEVRLNARMARETRAVSFPAPCQQGSPIYSAQSPTAAFGPQEQNRQRRKHANSPVVPPPAWYPAGTAD